MADPAPAPSDHVPPPAAPQAPTSTGFGDLFEQAMHALVGAPAAFRAAAARPAPAFGACFALALVSGAVSLAITIVYAVVESPALARSLSPLHLALAATAALGLFASLYLLLAVVLYALGRGFGGKGEFDRALQAAAALTILAPLQAVCNTIPFAWAAPPALAAWISACALEELFSAARIPIRVFCALLAAAAIGTQAVGRALTARAEQALAERAAVAQLAAQSAALGADFARQMQTLPGAPPGANAAAPAAPPVSGLDLLRPLNEDDDAPGAAAPAAAPGAAATAPPAGTGAAQQLMSAEQVRQMNQNALGMLDALTPMLQNPALTQRMKPAQKAQYNQLMSLMKDIRGQIAAGRPIPPDVQRQQMQQIQLLMISVMSSAAQAPQDRGPAPAPTPRLKPTGDGTQP